MPTSGLLAVIVAIDGSQSGKVYNKKKKNEECFPTKKNGDVVALASTGVNFEERDHLAPSGWRNLSQTTAILIVCFCVIICTFF